MSECARFRPLLDVYLDDAATPETNALVQAHIAHCGSCALELQSSRSLRVAMLAALGGECAPAALHQRVRASLAADTRATWAAAIRQWIIPASAAALVVVGFLRWDVRPSTAVESAVAEHVACALQGGVLLESAARYRPATAMPWLPHPDHQVRILDAHACGRQREYQHLVVERGDTKASILITARENGDPDVGSSQRNAGEFEVSVVGSPEHVAYLVVERARAGALRAWRAPAVERVERFLRQLEGL